MDGWIERVRGVERERHVWMNREGSGGERKTDRRMDRDRGERHRWMERKGGGAERETYFVTAVTVKKAVQNGESV